MEEYAPNVDMVNSLDAIPEVFKSLENGIEDSGDINARKRGGATYATFNAALGSSGLASVFARNGVIHGIDEVLLPPTENIVEIAMGNPNFSILVDAVIAAGFVDLLATTDNLTVFAPTNDAFVGLLVELGFGSLEELIDEDNGIGIEGLQRVLAYHVFAGRVYSSDLSNTTIKMFSGVDLTIDVSGPRLIDIRNRESNIGSTDIQATNGLIHVIDKVILPF